LRFGVRLEEQLRASNAKATSLEDGAAGHAGAISGCVVRLVAPQ
jgi:hypothetical protein